MLAWLMKWNVFDATNGELWLGREMNHDSVFLAATVNPIVHAGAAVNATPVATAPETCSLATVRVPTPVVKSPLHPNLILLSASRLVSISLVITDI